jgi:hypothetical protein
MRIEPGAVVVHHTGSAHVIRRRKEDNTGWWLTDGAGLSDRALLESGDWMVALDRAAIRAKWTATTTEDSSGASG